MSDDLAQPSPRGRRLRRFLAAAVVALAAVATVAGISSRKHAAAEPKSAALPKVETPIVEGKNITLPESFVSRAGIEFAEVKTQPIVPTIEAVGTVQFDAEHVAAAGVRARGFVHRVLKVEGDRVRKGEPLALVESAELGHAQAQVGAMLAKREALLKHAKREEQLLAERLTTAREQESARADLKAQEADLMAASQRVRALGGASSGTGLGMQWVVAPMDGTVVSRNVVAGQSVEGNEVAFRVANLDHLWIVLTVFERNLRSIRVGDRVDVTPSGTTIAPLKATVHHVSELIDVNTRSGEVRVRVDNSQRTLRPGQSVIAKISSSALAGETLCVPDSSLSFIDGRPTVFVARDRTTVSVREVKIGRTDGTVTEVLEGLTSGQTVVASGVFALKSELFR